MKSNFSNNIYCPVETTVRLIGGKYKPVILWHLKDKTLRFGELQRLVPTATPKMLTQQLRELESDHLIVRTVYPVVPPKTEYSLTDLGKTVIPVLDAMCTWGNEYISISNQVTCCSEAQEGKIIDVPIPFP